jgi:hypothetical protein
LCSVRRQAFTIENLTDCEVLLLDHSDQVQVDFVKGSKVFIGGANDTVFIRDCVDCTFTVACKQLRATDCHNCDIYLFTQTDPVIELSDGMRFGPFNGAYSGIEGCFADARLIVENNHWRNVFDFNVDHRWCRPRRRRRRR